MQFKNKTYENLLESILSSVAGDVLKIEGSIIHDATAPVAMALAEVYENLEFIINQTSVNTAISPYLDRLTEQMGIVRRMATYAERKGSFFNKDNELMAVSIGSRFSIEGVSYVVEELEADGTYRLMAEVSGSIGNTPIGEMQSLGYIEGLSKPLLSSVITPALDVETDNALRERYAEYITIQAQNGNAGQYQKWAVQQGFGRSKVFPLRNGANTVKVSILGADNKKASSSTIESLQEYLDPESAGLGNGVAPIGAIVTVATASENIVNVTANIEVADGYALDTVKGLINESLLEFFSDNAYKKSKVFYMDVGFVLLSTKGVSSVSDFTLNGELENIPLGIEEIGKLGTLEVGEV